MRVIAGERVEDAAAFVDALAAAFPLDPPVDGATFGSWDALADSLFAGLHALRRERVAIVWRAADVMRRRSPCEFRVAVDVLRQTVETLSEPRYTAGRPTEVLVLVELEAEATLP